MKLLSFKTAAVFGAMLAVAGCKEIRIGGFIESAADPDAKATVAGTFHCTPALHEGGPNYFADISGQFQYRDHGYIHEVNGKDHKLAFHGTVVDSPVRGITDEESTCDFNDLLFLIVYDEDGYCGEASIQPPPRPNDPMYGVDLRFRIAAIDAGEPGADAGDWVKVVLGVNDGFGCPLEDGNEYVNEGPLLGGNVQIPLPNGI